MIERMLKPDSAILPTCKCGVEMDLARIETKASDTELKIFRCPKCGDELRLMVWSEETSDLAPL